MIQEMLYCFIDWKNMFGKAVFTGPAGKIFPGAPEMKGNAYEKLKKNSGHICSIYTCLYGNCIVSVSA